MLKFKVSDMSCGHCKARISAALSQNKKIRSFDVDLEKKIVTVDTDLTAETISDLIDEAGYTAEKI